MSILFINGSPNKDGNTVGLAADLLAGKEYDTLHLVITKSTPMDRNMQTTSLWK